MNAQNPTPTSIMLRQRQELTHVAPLANTVRAASPKRAKTGKLTLSGVAVVALFAGGMSYWSASAPLASSAIAQGQVSLETNRKTVQHLEGGIISELHVREGQNVEAGDVLLILDQTQLQSSNSLLQARISSAKMQASLLNEELRSVSSMLKKGYARKPRLLALKRSLAELKGQVEQDEARLVANRDMMKRAELRAPVSGTVVGLKVHTIGGVIKAGDELLSIVAKRERLVIEAKINPNDIDIVHVGLKAQVRMTPYSSRLLAPLPASVNSISADKLTDETTGQDYYMARIALEDQKSAGLKAIRLMPGMPVEVAILTGSRSVMDYLLAPLLKSFGRAFQEE